MFAVAQATALLARSDRASSARTIAARGRRRSDAKLGKRRPLLALGAAAAKLSGRAGGGMQSCELEVTYSRA